MVGKSNLSVTPAVNVLLNTMIDGLAVGKRVEVGGFGSFSVKTTPARLGRNPRTGKQVQVSQRSAVKFKAGLDLAKRVRDSVR